MCSTIDRLLGYCGYMPPSTKLWPLAVAVAAFLAMALAARSGREDTRDHSSLGVPPRLRTKPATASLASPSRRSSGPRRTRLTP